MRVGVVGSGRIGGNIGRLLARAGHEVLFSFSRDPAKLEALAAEVGGRAGSPREAAGFGEVVVLSVPWGLVDGALEAAGPLDGKILLDTTNPYTRDGLVEPPGGTSAAEFNARRAGGARLVKAYNTLTAGFQAEAAGREDRVAMFYAASDEEAGRVVAGLIEDSGFEPAGVGGLSGAWILEAPRRDGAVYGEEYRPADAREISAALEAGDPEKAARLARERKAKS